MLECDLRGPKDWRNSRLPSGIERYKHEWSFQARLTISSEPHSKAPNCGKLRLKNSSEKENFTPNGDCTMVRAIGTLSKVLEPAMPVEGNLSVRVKVLSKERHRMNVATLQLRQKAKNTHQREHLGKQPGCSAHVHQKEMFKQEWNFQAKFLKNSSVQSRIKLECARIPFTLSMVKTKTMVLVFGFNFPFCRFPGKSGFNFGEKRFYFLVWVLPERRGWGIFYLLWLQGGPGTEPEPETRTVGTVFPGTERGTGTARTVFEPKPEPSSLLNCILKHTRTPSLEEPPEPKTGTARTVPSPNRNRTEPGPPCD